MLASQQGHERIVDTLLKGGARVDMQTKVPLYWVVHDGLLLKSRYIFKLHMNPIHLDYSFMLPN